MKIGCNADEYNVRCEVVTIVDDCSFVLTQILKYWKVCLGWHDCVSIMSKCSVFGLILIFVFLTPGKQICLT